MILDLAIAKRRGDFALDVAVAAAGERVTALFGASGAGKSTVVQAIAGMLRPDRGHIRVDGTAFFDTGRRIDLPPERRRVGYVFQDAKLFPHLSVRDNLRYGWRRARAEERRIAVPPVVDLLALGPLLDRRPHTLSGGERQRVALGRALLAQPRVLLMDEPLAALDAPRKAEILPFIERLRDEFALPIVYVSHALDEVVRLADALVVLDRGRVRAAGPLIEVMGRPDLRGLFGPVDFGAVLEAVVTGHEGRYGLSVLATPGGELRVPRIDAPVGGRVRVRIRSRDAALALDPPSRCSVVNVLTGTIAGLELHGGAGATAQIDLNGAALLADITRLSVDRLKLAPGLAVHVLIKAVALDRGTAAPDRGAIDG